MSSKATTFGAISVLNGIFNGIGCSLAVNLKVKVEVETIEEPEVITTIEIKNENRKVDLKLVNSCYNLVKNKFEYNGGFRIKIYSEIPFSRGLKSSSAVGNALIKAMTDAIGIKLGNFDIARLCVEACKAAGVTVTGAFDDACATINGGLFLVDNYSLRIISSYEVGLYKVIIGFTDSIREKASINPDKFKLLSNLAFYACKLIMKGKWLNAMNINAFLSCAALNDSLKPIILAIERGALASTLSGTGPSVVAISDNPDPIAEIWKEFGMNVIITETLGSKSWN
jgi:shikimate kinase